MGFLDLFKRRRKEEEKTLEVFDASPDRKYVKIGEIIVPRENIVSVDLEKGYVAYIDDKNILRVAKISPENISPEARELLHGLLV